MDTPAIYVACLASYNNGILYGQWISANQPANEVYEEIYAMLAKSPIAGAEEFAIHDYEGFGSINLHEYDSIDSIVEIADFIDKHGELGSTLLIDFSIEEAENLLQDHYLGGYESEVDFAKELFIECYEHQIPNNLISYFDYKAFARDLFINDYYSIDVHKQVHIFSI